MGDILIKGLELPKDHARVLVLHPDGRVIDEWGNTYQTVPVPPHGRLGDLDVLYSEMETYSDYCGAKEYHDDEMIHRDSILYAIEQAPTIIPAEPSEAQREYEAAVEQVQYCELYEPTYDPDTGAL